MNTNKIPNVKYYNISHLYWGKFPYCITVSRILFPVIHGDMCHSRQARIKQNNDRDDIVNTLLQLCTKLGDFRRVADFIDDRYYFISKSAAIDFITSIMDNGKLGKIVSIGSPKSVYQLDSMLETPHNLLFRSTLFFRKFEYKIVFKKLDLELRQEIISWIYEFYTDEIVDRFKCDKTNKTLTLLLTNSDDVMMTRLGYSTHINKIEHIELL